MTFNPASTDLRPCRQPALATKLIPELNEPAEVRGYRALKVVLSRTKE